MELSILPLNLPGISPDVRPLVISGPCSAESEEQVINTATDLQRRGVQIFRAGVWKPRTKPGGFEGVGEPALPWLVRVQKELGMLVATEVATPAHVQAALRYGIDVLWVGARTVANPFAMQELADSLRGVDVPVLVKNPVSPDLELWIGGLQRLNGAGVKRLAAIHRGFSSYEHHVYRNRPLWHIAIELHRRIPELPILCDPSHMGGHRELIAPLCQQAMDLGYHGLMIESHCCPEKAWSDAEQQLTPAGLSDILQRLILRTEQAVTPELLAFRERIDQCDNELLRVLGRRLAVCREIGKYKRERNMQIVQPVRYNEILLRRGEEAIPSGLSASFVRELFERIHEESVVQQLEEYGLAPDTRSSAANDASGC